jgi:hypothetical protein
MRRLIVLGIVCSLFLSCGRGVEMPVKPKAVSNSTAETQNEKELEEIRKSIRGDVKIKLKKDGKGSYSWEISGRDAQEVLKTNDALRKRLND